jgi:HD superfamily phosphohydrolase YqeK
MDLRGAARGALPSWADASDKRRAHMSRVADVMERWCRAFGLDDGEVVRWRAAAWLHDALRDAPAERLRPLLEPAYLQLPDSFLHGPATAAKLAAEGCTDNELLDAIRFHTLGHHQLGRLGLALIAADYLEPGRSAQAGWRAALRVRLPTDFDAVVLEVVGDKIRKTVERTESLRPEMISLWNRCVERVAAH